MNHEQLMQFLKHRGACRDAQAWIAAEQLDAQSAWERCPRSDWLLWIAARCGVEHRRIVLAGCACARLALKYVLDGEDRPRIAIETTERWCQGEATIDEVRKARRAAYVSAYAADAAAPDAAAPYTTAQAAAAYAAAYAADHMADAAAYAAAYANDSRQQMQQACADAVRRLIRFEDLLLD